MSAYSVGIAGIIGLCLCILFDNAGWRSAVFVTLGIYALYSVRARLSHPYTWFIPPFALYSLSAPNIGVAAYLGDLTPFSSDAVLMAYLALLGFVVGAAPTRSLDLRRAQPVPDARFAFLREGAMPLLLLSGLLTVLFVLVVARSGLNKSEIALSGPLLARTQFSFSLLLLSAYTALVGVWYRAGRVPVFSAVLLAAWFLVISAISAERDIFLRLAVVGVVLTDLFVRRISVPKMAAFAAAGILLLGILGVYRAAVVRGSEVRLSGEAIVDETLGGEFSSASQNLMVLLQGFERGDVDFQYGETFANDVAYVLTPVNMFTDRATLNVGGAWFNRTFFPARYELGGGSGFTMVGEAYLNFGEMGIILFFAGLGWLLRALYRRTDLASFALLYALIIPGALYAIRGDLATLLAYSVKQIIIPALLVAGAARIVIRATRIA